MGVGAWCRWALALKLTLTLAVGGGPLMGQDQPLTPTESAAAIALPPGFHATLFAGEPDVVQPIAFAFDARGRLWVVECLSYPDWSRDGQGRDRVLIFEDVNGDGRFDRRTVFWDQGVNLSGIELGFGGVWLCATPNLLFIPDRDGDDKPDGPAEVLLDGWDLNASHNVFNGLTWGPDGWLYGCNGILSRSRVGAPGAPAHERTELDCGVWRFHPTWRRFEPVAWGTTNPWGLDFDAWGQMFITNCVIKHVFHVVPGIHMIRMFGQDLNPFVYHLVPSCADHIHWAGGYWDTSIGGKHDDTGGGHAHAGAMIYQGDNWPAEYRDRIYLHNIHGRRINSDRLVRHGASYVAQHADDMIMAHDPWWRGLQIKYGPDGSVFLSDWNDTGECHDRDQAEKGTGRIFRVAYGACPPVRVDLQQLGDQQLLNLQAHSNEWFARQSRIILQARAAEQDLGTETQRIAWELFRQADVTTLRLRILWTLHALRAIDALQSLELLAHPDEYVRAWAIQLELEDREIAAGAYERLLQMAAQDASPLVRLYLAAALSRLPLEQRWPLASRLVEHTEDAEDLCIPALIWYGIEPLVPSAEGADMALLRRATLPLVRQLVARRIVAAGDAGLTRLVKELAQEHDAGRAGDLLQGLFAELEGTRELPMPPEWPTVRDRWQLANDAAMHRSRVRSLSLIFGDAAVRDELQQQLVDHQRPVEERLTALAQLLMVRAPGLSPILLRLLDEPDLRLAALRGLALYEDPEIPRTVLGRYAQFDGAARQESLMLLTARIASAQVLVAELEAGRLPPRELTAYHAAQLQQLGDEDLHRRFQQSWGQSQPTPADKRATIVRLQRDLTPARLAAADHARGQQLFTQKCASCHQLFGAGAQIGPDLTGSQRENRDYILENVVTPNALVPGDFLVRTLELHDGRVVAGIVVAETPRTITVQTLHERLILVRAEIEADVRSTLSLMPEGLLDDLSADEVADLVAYLGRKQPLP